jgi:hypothetical protein
MAISLLPPRYRTNAYLKVLRAVDAHRILGGMREPAAYTALRMPPKVLAELRCALLADLRSLSKDMGRFIGEFERAMERPDPPAVAARRRDWVKATKAIQTRQRLHELDGWPADALEERTISDPACCALAIGVLTEHREAKVAKLAANLVPEDERAAEISSVSLLTRFLRRPGARDAELLRPLVNT